MRVSTNYITKVDGTSVILTCDSTIPGDTLSNIIWKLNGVEIGRSNQNIELGYADINPVENNIYQIEVSANIGTDELTYLATTYLASENIFGTTTEYTVSSSGTEQPSGEDVVWVTEMPTIELGKYLWTRFGTIYLNGVKNYRYEVTYWGKNGASATSFKLKVNPNVINLDEQSPEVTFSVLKIAGGSVTEVPAGFNVVNNTTNQIVATRVN